MNDFIFCPFCAGNKWVTEKFRHSKTGQLEEHRCAACKNFTYVNNITSNGSGQFSKTRFSVRATIEPYHVTVFYEKNATQICDVLTANVILVLDQIVDFNWYRKEEVETKIKTYVVFS